MARLKRRKPWRGHIGQRLLVPGRWMRELVDDPAIEWHNLVQMVFLGMLCTAVLLPLAPFDGAPGWLDVVFVGLLTGAQVSILKGLGWKLGAKPLNDWEVEVFRKTLIEHPDCMAAVMHWLTPDTVLRAADQHLLRRVVAKKNTRFKPQDHAARRAVLAVREALAGQDCNSEVLTRTIQTKAAACGKSWKRGGWPDRIVTVLSTKTSITAYTFPGVPRLGIAWFFNSTSAFLALCAAIWMIRSWMGDAPTGRDIMLPLDGMAVFGLLLLAGLPIPIARTLHYRFSPISDEDIQAIGRGVLLQDTMAVAYMKALPETREWTRIDIAVAIEMESLPSKNRGEATPGNTQKDYDQEARAALLPLWMEKPWRGGWAQRLLVPSRPIQELGNDLSSRPAMATCLVLLACLALLLPVGLMMSVGTINGGVGALGVGLLQIELLRLVCYLNVSAKLWDIDGAGGHQATRLGAVAKSIPGGAQLVDLWRKHPSGLRVADLNKLKKCARRYPHSEISDKEPDNGNWYPDKGHRGKILQAIAARGAPADDEKARRLARTVGRPLDLVGWGGLMGQRGRDAFTIALDIYIHIWSPARVMAMGGVLIVFAYAAMAGVAWVIAAGMGEHAGGWDIALPFGTTVSLALAGSLAALLGFACWLVNRSIAPVGALEVFETETIRSMDAGPCLSYLGNLPPDRHWTFQDLFRARALILREEQANARVRQVHRRAREVELILSTREATIGHSRAQCEQMDETTVIVLEEEATPAPVRRF